MDPLLRPEFLLLLLEQEDRSLEDHTRLFRFLTNTTSYPDDTLCSLYDASLNTACRALSSEDGPREDFAAFVEWTLARNGSPLTVSQEDDLARSTPEPSPPSPRGTEHQPEPTDGGEPFPAAICEPARNRATERMIVPEVDLPNPSDQVREPVTMLTTREPAVDGVSAEWSSAPCTAAEVELIVHLGLLDMEGDLIDWETELEYEMPPLLSPSSPLVPSSPEGASDSPVPAPRQRPPVLAPRQRPPMPAPRQRPPGSVQLSRAPAGSVQLSSAPAGSVQLSSAPAGSVQLSRAPAGSIQLSRAPAGSIQLSPAGSVRLPRAPAGSVRLPRAPNVRASRAPPGVRASGAEDEEFPQYIFLGG